MDLDYYDLLGIVQSGDATVDIQLTSGQDFVMVNNIIASVNSELSDATIVIDDVGVLCENNNIDVNYTVYDINSTAPLALNTPIAFYADAILIGQTQTVADIPIGGSESGTITLNIPVGTPNIFTLRAVVDDLGNGTGVVAETDETNNEFSMVIDLSMAGILLDSGPACLGSAVVLDSGVTDPPFNIQWYLGAIPVAIPGATSPTLNVVADGIYSVVAIDGICSVTSNQVLITFNPQPIAFPPIDLFQCDFGTTAGVFDLTENDDDILGAQDPALFNIKYYATLLDSQNDTNAIIGPAVHLIVPPSPQTIFARIENLTGSCFDLEQFRIYFSRAIAGVVPVTYSLCDVDQNGGEFIDLFTEFNALVLDGEPSSSYTITYHGSQADADANLNPHPNPYFVTAPSEIVYIRLENRDDTSCFDTLRNITILVDTLPVINSSPPTLILCDSNNDGFAEFDLSVQTPVITLGDPSLTVTYHGTFLDAENDVFPLPNPYTNDAIYLDFPITDTTDPLYGTGGVWARVQSTVNSCHEVVPFALEVRFTPGATTPAEPLRQCDDTVADGFTFFDLTVVEPEVLGGLNPTEFDIYYYEDIDDAVLAGDLALTAPDFSQAIATPTAFLNATNPQDIYILVVGNSTSTHLPNPNSGEGCYDIVILTLIVDPIPEDLGPFEIMLCDDDLNGSTLDDEISTFDLTTQNVLVNGGDPTIIVTWYETPADETMDDPILDPTMYQNTSTPQTVLGRATSEFGCRNVITLTLTVLPNPNPKTDPSALELCDDDDDGIVGGFDPSLRDIEIIDGEPNVSVLYYELLEDAMDGIPGSEIIAPYTNVDAFSQIIYARVTKDVPPATVACYTIVELELVVIPLPDMPEAAFQDPFIGCDESGNGQAIFDLTLQDAAVLGVQNPSDFVFPITYYEMLVDAGAGTNEIAPANAFLSGGQPIWVRLESLVTGCIRITEFQIEVGVFPTIGVGGDLSLCDDQINGSTPTDGFSTFDLTVNTPLIDLGDITLTVLYYATASDQINNQPIGTPDAYQNIISPQQQIFASAFSTQGCEATSQFYINVEPIPLTVTPTPLLACDPNNDGFAEFDLSNATSTITNGDVNLSVTYFGTLTEAENNGIPLTNPYPNDNIYNDVPVTDPADLLYGTGGVWARVETTVNSCHAIVPFTLEVRSAPVATTPAEPLRQCDDAVADGFTLFDLTVVEPEVLGTLSPTEYDIYFYEDMIEAVLAGDLALTAPDFSQAIQVPTAYLNTLNPQDIYILVVGNPTSSIPPNPNSGEGCYDIVVLTLIVDLVPLDLGPFEMMLCDDELNGSSSDDEISTFDLTTQDVNVNGGDPSITVLWFKSLADEAADIPIPDPTMYQNIASPQTVFGRATSAFGCSVLVTLTLTVLPNPAPVTPTPLVACDNNNDGFALFNLTDKDDEIKNGQANVSVSYHEGLLDATNGTFALEDPYGNLVAGMQTLWVRVTNDTPPAVLGCYTIVELELIVSPTPLIPADLPDLLLCDDDGFGIFDLTTQEVLIYVNGQTPSDYSISYHTDPGEAQNGTDAIGTPEAYMNVFTPEEIIYVRLTNVVSDCFKVEEFLLKVSLGPVVNQPDPLSQCDDVGEPNDGFTTFNLTQRNDEITGAVPGVEVRYYLTQQAADDDDDTNRIDPDTAYTNTGNPQLIYARVIDGNTECFNTGVTLTLRVVPNPSPTTPDPIMLCDDTLSGDEMEVFDLTIREGQITGGENWDLLYYEDLTVASDGDPLLAIVDPSMYTNTQNPQTIYVLVTVPVTQTFPLGCFEIVELELIVNPLPDDTATIEKYTLCEVNNDGVMDFDLTTKIPEALNGQDPSAFSVFFFRTPADATANMDPIVNVTSFSNTSNPQTLYVGIENIATGCYIASILDPVSNLYSLSFDLEVLEGAAATTPAAPYSLCDTTGDNDGFTEFDLSAGNTALYSEILGTQTTPAFNLDFYQTPEEAEAGVLATSLPIPYTNVINPQIIYARVTNALSECYDIVEVILNVEQLPVINLEDEYRLCVDINGNPIAEVEGEMSPPVIDTGLDPTLYDIVWEYPGGTATGPSIVALEGGTYTVTYSEPGLDGCSRSIPITVTVSQPPVIYNAVLVNGAFSDAHVIQATAEGLSDNYVFQLDNGEFIDSGTFENVRPGGHTVTFKDANGCGSVTIEVGVIDYPRFVTPNQDGYHDTWNIIGIAEFDPIAKIYIFDRFGKLLKQVSPVGEGWNGTYKGNSLPSSDYWFVVEYTEEGVQKEFKGHFTLKR
jgi:gliding motility-associated-like protein